MFVEFSLLCVSYCAFDDLVLFSCGVFQSQSTRLLTCRVPCLFVFLHTGTYIIVTFKMFRATLSKFHVGFCFFYIGLISWSLFVPCSAPLAAAVPAGPAPEVAAKA